MEVYDSKYVLMKKGIIFEFVTFEESLVLIVTKKEEEIQTVLTKKECLYLSKIFLEAAINIDQQKNKELPG